MFFRSHFLSMKPFCLFMLIDKDSFANTSERSRICFIVTAGVGYHRRNPQRRIRAEVHFRMCRVQRFARPPLCA
jgi:hypothetical protein